MGNVRDLSEWLKKSRPRSGESVYTGNRIIPTLESGRIP